MLLSMVHLYIFSKSSWSFSASSTVFNDFVVLVSSAKDVTKEYSMVAHRDLVESDAHDIARPLCEIWNGFDAKWCAEFKSCLVSFPNIVNGEVSIQAICRKPPIYKCYTLLESQIIVLSESFFFKTIWNDAKKTNFFFQNSQFFAKRIVKNESLSCPDSCSVKQAWDETRRLSFLSGFESVRRPYLPTVMHWAWQSRISLLVTHPARIEKLSRIFKNDKKITQKKLSFLKCHHVGKWAYSIAKHI